MRKLIALTAVALSVTACTPRQVAQFLGHGRVTAEDVRLAAKVTVFQKAQNLSNIQAFWHFVDAVHNDPFLVCTRGHESDTAGGYRAYNPAGPWYGAYQFTQGTWNNAAIHAGFPELAGADILNVNGFVQDFVAMTLHNMDGNQPWGGRC